MNEKLYLYLEIVLLIVYIEREFHCVSTISLITQVSGPAFQRFLIYNGPFSTIQMQIKVL